MVNLEVLNPVANVSKQEVSLAPRLGELSGKTIGLYWNAKPTGDIINQFTTELLTEKFKDIRLREYLVSVHVVGVVHHASVEELDVMAKECDAVVGTLGD